jgi:hypothetical protein
VFSEGFLHSLCRVAFASLTSALDCHIPQRTKCV